MFQILETRFLQYKDNGEEIFGDCTKIPQILPCRVSRFITQTMAFVLLFLIITVAWIVRKSSLKLVCEKTEERKREKINELLRKKHVPVTVGVTVHHVMRKKLA